MKTDFYCWQPDFANVGTLPTSGPADSGLLVTDTSAAGTPTYAYQNNREVLLQHSSDAEVQNVCLSMGDKLHFDIDEIAEARFRLKMNQANLDAATQFSIGLAAARNDAIDSIAQAILFRLVGSDSIVVESDDGTNDNDDIATGKSLTNSYVDLTISLAEGKDNVLFFIDGQPVATATTFDMSNYSGSLQFFAQLQKTADANTDGVLITDRSYIRGRN